VGQFEIEIVLFAAGAELDLLDLADVGALLIFFFLLRFFVLVFAEITNTAHWRARIWGDFHQIKSGSLGQGQRFVCIHDAHLLALGVHDSYLSDTDAFVYPDAGFPASSSALTTRTTQSSS